MQGDGCMCLGIGVGGVGGPRGTGLTLHRPPTQIIFLKGGRGCKKADPPSKIIFLKRVYL